MYTINSAAINAHQVYKCTRGHIIRQSGFLCSSPPLFWSFFYFFVWSFLPLPAGYFFCFGLSCYSTQDKRHPAPPRTNFSKRDGFLDNGESVRKKNKKNAEQGSRLTEISRRHLSEAAFFVACAINILLIYHTPLSEKIGPPVLGTK